MKLYLEKRGCDFWEDDKDARQHSDLENYRLFLEFIDRDGKRICGDVSRGAVRSGDWRKGKPVIVSTNGLYTDFEYENHTGCYCYQSWRGPAGDYTKADVLKLVNSLSAVQYDGVEIVDNLPDAAHEYPENVIELERVYLAGEHAAMVEETKQKINDSFITWYNGLQWSFHKMTPAEYKECTLLAFRLMADEYGVLSERPEPATPASFVAHRMSKHFFEGQDIIDPYADEAFLFELEKHSPYYIGRYLPEMTLAEFASRIDV